MNVSLVVLSRYPDLFEGFAASVAEYEPTVDKILVRDGNQILIPKGWRTVNGVEPFNFGVNLNRGWWMAGDADVVLSGDDVRFHGPFIENLQKVAYSDNAVGIATIQFWGQSPFVCGYFKRSVIDKVGLMDERFTGYGREDMDWCARMERLGCRTQPTESVTAQHTGGTSFFRRAKETGRSMEEMAELNNRLFEEKWNIKTP